VLLIFLRAVIGTAFLASAVLKLSDLSAFVDSLPRFGVPRRYRGAVGWTLVGAELTTALTVVAGGPLLVTGFAIASVLLAAFSVVILTALGTGVVGPCHCFGKSLKPLSRVDLGRNGGFLVLAVIGLLLTTGSISAAAGQTIAILVTATRPQTVIGLVAGLAFALVWSQLSEVIHLFSADPIGIGLRQGLPHD